MEEKTRARRWNAVWPRKYCYRNQQRVYRDTAYSAKETGQGYTVADDYGCNYYPYPPGIFSDGITRVYPLGVFACTQGYYFCSSAFWR
jgi:hypothetical protein